MRAFCPFAILVLSVAAPLAAQTGQASLSGQITDPSGAVMPGVMITVKNEATNVTRTTPANEEGFYSIPGLIPGVYSLRVESQGFRTIQRDGIVLRVGDRINIDISMEVGQQAEAISVSAEVPLLRTEDVQTGLVIDNRRIQELPQYNRNALAFALLTPNVSSVSSEQAGHDEDFRINGGRTSQAEYFVDGVPVTTGYRHDIPPSVPSMEAISEFKVLTNGLSAEYGRLSGGAVTLVTRSGTNNYHGSAYEFFRNDKLNANDWNSNRFGRAKGVFHDNVFGGSLGGPVRIPKLYNGRDRTFFFLNFEGTRRSTGSNAATAGVPTALERQGDFSQSLIDSGVPVTIFDPLTARTETGRVVRDAFPGNRIPQSRIDPLSSIYLGHYPEPNQPARPNSSHDQNFIGTTSSPYNNDRWTGRLDQNWSASHTTHFTLTRFDDNLTAKRWLSPLQPIGFNSQTSHTVTLDHTVVITPTTILNLRGGMVRLASTGGSAVDPSIDSSSWPMQPEIFALIGGSRDRVPGLGTGDTIATLGGGAVNIVRDTSYTGAVSLQKLWRKHTFKFGYEHRRYYSNVTSGGSLSTATQRSVTSRFFDAPAPTGSGFASWLLGSVTGGSGTQLAGPASLLPYHGAYVQDDIKLSSKLTVNLGLRWDYEPPRTERFDRQFWWDKSYQWPWKPNPGWSWEESLQQAGALPNLAAPDWTKGFSGRVAMTGTPEYPTRVSQRAIKNHFGPRLGVAWQFLPRTVLRAGYGLQYLTTSGGLFLNGAPWNIGYGDFARFIQGGSPDGGLTFPLTFSQPMPGGAGYVPATRNIDELNRSVMGGWFIANAIDQAAGHEHAFQLGIQREIGSGENTWVLEVNYSGNVGRNLPFWLGTGEHILPDAYNILGPLGSALNNPVSNPFFGQIPANTGQGGRTLPFGRLFQRNPLWQELWTMGEPLGSANYNAGYVQIEHRFGRGFSFLAHYTISKLLQDVGGIDNQHSQGPNQQAFPQAGLPLSDIYGIAPQDTAQRFLFNYSVELPFGKGKRFLSSPRGGGGAVLDKIVGGWRLAGTTTYRTGQPILVFTPSGGVGGLGSQWYNIGHGRTTRPRFVTPGVDYDNRVPGHTALEGAGGFQHYMNPAAFRLVEGFEIGDVPSTFPNFRGPGYAQWDLSMLKDFRLWSESSALQLRFEAQNFFNKMNPGNPNGAVTQRTFGVITGQAGSPRRVMIAAKIVF
ncbi:MAG: TonB-dependent receptor [Bryobacteraceae bacterium]